MIFFMNMKTVKVIPMIFTWTMVTEAFVQRNRNNNVVFWEEELPEPKQSKSVLSDIANEIIRRSSNSSEVLNLNLSNLLLLLVLKAIVYGAGFISNHDLKGREDVEGNNSLSEGEAVLALGYLIGDNCLYRAACEVPHTAKEYLGAADMVLQTIKLIPQFVSIDDSYEKKIIEFQKAIDQGINGQCPTNYNCKKENINRFLRPE